MEIKDKAKRLLLTGEEGRCGLSLMGMIFLIAAILFVYSGSRSPVADRIVNVLNTEYGKVCRAELNGLFEKTLMLDWTKDTNYFQSVSVMKEIDGVKDKLKQDGVRYFRFPNDGGTYNTKDWQTGAITSSIERSPYYFNERPSPYAKQVINILNTEYGRVCQAKLEGKYEKKLRIDWTAKTKLQHVSTIFNEIGSVKESLYKDGVRYFQFPNDAGTCNVIDWQTGDKWSVEDRAAYYFK